MKGIRYLLFGLLLAGLATGFCGGLGQMVIGRSIYLIHEFSQTHPQDQVEQLAECQRNLDACYQLATISLFLGASMVILASVALSRSNRLQRGA